MMPIYTGHVIIAAALCLPLAIAIHRRKVVTTAAILIFIWLLAATYA